MNLKSLFHIVLILFLIPITSWAQNNPQFDLPERDTVIIHSGRDFLIISDIQDGDSGEQELSLEVATSNEAVLKVDSVSYKQGNRMALIWVSDQGVLGTVDLSVTLTDADGSTTKEFQVLISEYTHYGLKFEIHDAIFWQEVVPLNETPIYQTIVQTTNMGLTYNKLPWSKIPLTVSAGCNNPSLCDGHDFNTGFVEGFLAPKISGNYTFYMNAPNDFALFLSTTEKFQNANVIASSSDNHGKVGTVVDGYRKSVPVSLDSGKVYAFYAAQWNVHNESGGIKWELPGHFSSQFIESPYIYPEHDTKRPDIVKNISIGSVGDRFLRVTWDASKDDQKLKGYHVYLNGKKANSSIVTSTDFLIEGLEGSTTYSIAVTAVDHVNNESLVNNIVNAKTLETDDIPPTPPTSLTIVEATGLALEISWDGASDDQSGIYAYHIYLNGELYNTESLVFGNSVVLKVLQPDTEYAIQIEALDNGRNVSEKSQIFKVNTTTFDPLDDNLGLNTGKLVFSTKAMSYNEGLGINADYKNGPVFNTDHTMLLEDMKPGAIRWGALTANPLSFSDYVGADKSVTIGKFIERCNEFGAFTAFCCGVEDQTDWRKDPETFIRFLEYINGPDDTEGGQLRVAEGYTEPFLKNSPGLIFEFGNEVWGSTAHEAQIGKDYNVYAAWVREIARKMRASAYYDSTKIFLAYSSRYPSREQSYGLNEKIINGDQGEVDWTAPSGYLGGNLNYDPALPAYDSELEYYQNVRNRADNYLTGILSSHKYEVEKTGQLMEQYMYESNTTTPTYNGRLGQALVSFDYYLTAMELGSAIPTIFHLTGGQWRITEPENNYRRLPLFLTAKYFNHFCKGDVLNNTYTSNQNKTSGTGARFSERPVGAHTYRNEKGYSMVFVSRDYVNDHYVQVELPEDFNYNPEGKLFQLTGEDFNTKNMVIDTLDITIEDGMIINVPKHAMVLVHFTADEIEMENLPLAYYPYPKIESIQIPQGNQTISKPLESKMFSAVISPSDSWDRMVKWTLLNNSGNFNINELGLYCTVSARSDLANDTDSLILRASSRIGDVYTDVVIYLPNSLSAEKILDNEAMKIYPNPVKDKLMVEVRKNDKLEIYNAAGTKVMEKIMDAGWNEIPVHHLTNGVYTVKVGNNPGQLIIKE